MNKRRRYKAHRRRKIDKNYRVVRQTRSYFSKRLSVRSILELRNLGVE